MRNVILVSFLALLMLSAVCGAYPEPTKSRQPGIWTLKTEIQHPEQITVNIPGKGLQRFWYIIMTVTNTTDEDIPFYSRCELMTDTFKITLAGETQGFVFEHLKIRYQGQFPFLENLEDVDNRVLIGDDNTRDIAVIWPDFDAKAKNVKLFLAGLSNETAKVEHPLNTDEQGKPELIYLRKTLYLDYSIGGDSQRRGESRLNFEGKNWVMR